MDLDLYKLCEYGEAKRIKKGTIIQSENSPVDGFCYLLLEGLLEERKAFNMDNAYIRDIEAGDVAGLLELFSGHSNRLTTIKAVEDSKLYMWSKKGIERIATSNLKFSLYIIKKLSTTLRGLDFELKELIVKKEENS